MKSQPIISIELQKSVYALVALRAKETKIRPIVEAYQLRAFNEFELFDTHTSEKITDVKYAWCAPNEQWMKFYERCEQYKFETGLETRPEYCPLLGVEEEIRKAENAMIDAAKYITGFDSDDTRSDLNMKKEAVRLITGLVLSAPKNKLAKIAA